MLRIVSLLILIFSASRLYAAPADAEQKSLTPIHHIIVVYLENHSFDNIMGKFPGADGIANAGKKFIQTDASGKPYAMLPAVLRDKKPDPRFPVNLPNQPFLITQYVSSSNRIGDLVHRYYQTIAQTDGGAMDKFVANSNAGGLTMGYYDDETSPLWQYARKYTLADHFFTAAYGGSALNHFWLICACTPQHPNAPQALRAVLDDKGNLVKDGALTPDGYAVNTIQPFTPPYDPRAADPATRLPLQTMPTIGDRLSEKHIDWAWYGGGWNDAVSGKAPSGFPYHHHPFAYFAPYAEGKPGRNQHLKDETDFVAAIEKGTLPPVSFYKPSRQFDLHPGYTDIAGSEAHVFALIRKIEASSLWKDSLIIVTFDDAGGFWDHVAPPKGDRFGPGVRIPTLLISPFARQGYIDHTTYDTTSILKLIETKYDLKPLGERDAKAHNLIGALQ